MFCFMLNCMVASSLWIKICCQVFYKCNFDLLVSLQRNSLDLATLSKNLLAIFILRLSLESWWQGMNKFMFSVLTYRPIPLQNWYGCCDIVFHTLDLELNRLTEDSETNGGKHTVYTALTSIMNENLICYCLQIFWDFIVSLKTITNEDAWFMPDSMNINATLVTQWQMQE